MSARLAELLAPMLRAVTLLSPTRYRLDGHTEVDIAELPPASREDPFFHADPLLHHLHRDIYVRFHAGFANATTPAETRTPNAHDFTAALQAANACKESWDEGWIVVDVSGDGSLIAEKAHRVCRWVPGQYRYDGAPKPPRRKDSVSVLHLAHSLQLQDGYFHAMGAWTGDDVERLGGLRVYFNVDADHIAALLALLTGELQRRQLPFRFKCPSHPHDYVRVDTAVLYVATRHARLVLMILEELHPRLARWLRAPTPLLALRIADGIAIAEEPADGNSFGAGRALAVAEGLQQAFAAGTNATDTSLAAVLRAFEARGYSLDHPHLMATLHDSHGLRQLQPFAD